MVERPIRIGLALSGGAALGLAHIGALKVLDRESIPVVAIAGTSMGSLVGGLYAAGYSPTQIESLALDADWNHLFSSSVPFGAQYLPERQQAQRYAVQLRHKNFVPFLPGGIVPLQNVEFLLMHLLCDAENNTRCDLDSLPIPCLAVAVDLQSGELVVMRKVRLEQAIRASIAIPGVFSPEKLNGRELVDGGVQRLLPVDVLDSIDSGLDLRIAVLPMKRNPETGISLIDIASRSIDLAGLEDLKRQRALADIVIEPDVDPFTHSDFAKVVGLIAAGESAAEAALPRIRELIAGRTLSRHRNAVQSRLLPVVKAVRFDGLRVTRERTVRKEIHTGPGDALDFGRLVDDLTRLFNTGLFDDVNYRLDDVAGDSVDLTIEVQERAYGFYSLGLRYDDYTDLALGFEVGQGNLGGFGATARAALDVGDPTEFRLGLNGTNLSGLPFGYRLDGFWGSIDRTFYEQGRWRGIYKVRYVGGVAEAGYILGRNAFFDLGMNGYYAVYRSPDSLLMDSLRAGRPEWIVGPSFRLEASTFRDIGFPTSGRASRFDVLSSLTALKGTHEFLRMGFSSEWGIRLHSSLLLRPALDVGVSFGELALAEQFRTGGPSFVGFEWDEFTSAQRVVTRLGVDFLACHLFGQESYPVYLQAMGNAGTFAPWDDLLELSSVPPLLHWGAGVGACTNTPIGPVQLVLGVGDFGGKLPTQPSKVAFVFSLGREFRYTR